MSDFATFAKALGLKEDADEQAIVAAIEAKDTATFAGHETLEDAAKADGKVVFSRADADKLKADAGAVETLSTEVDALKQRDADREFEAQFAAALNDPKGAKVAPAEKDTLREIFDSNRETFAKLIDVRAPLVNAKAKGARGDETEVPDNVEPESFDIDREAKAFMADNAGTSYRDAVFAVTHKREQAQR